MHAQICVSAACRNLVVFVWDTLHGHLQVAIFEGTCYTTPIIGALLADSMWGRYKTIMVFSIIYLCVRVVPPAGGWGRSRFCYFRPGIPSCCMPI